MALDIDPVVPQGRQLIQAYGGGRFKIAGQAFDGSVLIFPERTDAWSAEAVDAITVSSLQAVLDEAETLDILLIGCGPSFQAVPKGLRQALKDAGLVLEWMDSGAACRTFNVLLAEERRVAAAILAVD